VENAGERTSVYHLLPCHCLDVAAVVKQWWKEGAFPFCRKSSLFQFHRLHISLEMRVRFQEGFSRINLLIQSISVRSNRPPCMTIFSSMEAMIQDIYCGVQPKK